MGTELMRGRWVRPGWEQVIRSFPKAPSPSRAFCFPVHLCTNNSTLTSLGRYSHGIV